jgi:putative inorganic carbon (hco3(-)) transporter
MRDLIITAIVLAAMVYGFKRPWVGVSLWVWLSVMNPHRMAYGFAFDAPFAAMAAGSTFLALVLTKEPVRLPRSGPVYVLVLFILWMAVTTLFAYFPADSFEQLNKVFKIQLMTLVALAVLLEKKYILVFVGVNTLSLGILGVKGGLYTIATGGGGRVWGPGGFITGNNEFGLALVMIIPFLYFAYLQLTHKWMKVGLMFSMLLTTIAVLGTQSRGAFLAVAAMGVVLWWRAPRKLLTGTIIVCSAAVALAVMSEQFSARMATIKTFDQDTSAVGRIYAWQTAFNIANERPFGAGFSMYQQEISDRYGAGLNFAGKINEKILEARAAHSIYFQVLGEHGWVGLFLFLLTFFLTWRVGSRLRRLTKGRAELQWVYQLAGMSQVSLAGFAVGGAFLSLAYFDLPYNVLVILVATDRWLAAQTVTQPSTAPLATGQNHRPAAGRLLPVPPRRSDDGASRSNASRS